MRATHVFAFFQWIQSVNTFSRFRCIEFKSGYFTTKEYKSYPIQILEKSPIFKEKTKINFHTKSVGKQEKERCGLQTFSHIAFVFSAFAWL